MATLVRQRKFKKVKRNTFKKKVKKTKLIYPQIKISIKWFRIIILVAIFWYGLFFIINNTIFSAENYIEQINYSKESVDTYDNPELYKKISEMIKYENFYVASKLQKGTLLTQLKQEFPMVKNITIVQQDLSSAAVKVDFYEPEILIQLWDRKFAVLGEYDFEIFSWNKIWNNIFTVEIPQYSSGLDNLYWLFFEINSYKFIQDMHIIQEWFPNAKRIVYLPWASRTLVFMSDTKRLYLNNKNSLTWQILNYNLLNKYYDKSDTLKIIDLWSLDSDKIIVR